MSNVVFRLALVASHLSYDIPTHDRVRRNIELVPSSSRPLATSSDYRGVLLAHAVGWRLDSSVSRRRASKSQDDRTHKRPSALQCTCDAHLPTTFGRRRRQAAGLADRLPPGPVRPRDPAAAPPSKTPAAAVCQAPSTQRHANAASTGVQCDQTRCIARPRRFGTWWSRETAAR